MYPRSDNTPLQTSESFFWTYWSIFSLGFIAFFPVNPQILPDVQHFINPIIAPLLSWIGSILWPGNSIDTSIWSDSKSMYALVVLMTTIALMATTILHFRNYRLSPKTRYWFQAVIRYYIAYQLMHYGFNKVFKWQFFLPEPNIAYTNIGAVSRDLLYWSAIGSSYWYTVIAGGLEVLAGLCLVFGKSQRIGLMLSLVLLSNIVLVNFTFNISVKLFSLFLLTNVLALLSSHWLSIKAFIQNKAVNVVHFKPQFKYHKRKEYVLTKTAIILILMVDSLWIYGKTGNWNDDVQARPILHGSYSVSNQTTHNWDEVYVHRKAYLIIKDKADVTTSYQLAYDTANHAIKLTGEQETFEWLYNKQSDGNIELRTAGTNEIIRLKSLPYKSLPLFRKQYNWWID